MDLMVVYILNFEVVNQSFTRSFDISNEEHKTESTRVSTRSLDLSFAIILINLLCLTQEKDEYIELDSSFRELY